MRKKYKKGNILISAATGYDIGEVRTFVESAVDNIPKCNIVLLREKNDKSFEKELKKISEDIEVRKIDVNKIDKIVKILPKKIEGYVVKIFDKLGFMLKSKLSIRFKRYFEYIEVLEESEANRAIICDSRDVIFQNNPLDKIENEVVAGLEEQKFKNSDLVQKWTKSIYSEDILRETYDKEVICSGVILGNKEKMIRLVKKITKEIRLIEGLYKRNGGDQALINKLKYVDGIDLETVNNDEGIILTVGARIPKDMKIDKKIRKVKIKDKEISVLHQYDRHESIKRKLYENNKMEK